MITRDRRTGRRADLVPRSSGAARSGFDASGLQLKLALFLTNPSPLQSRQGSRSSSQSVAGRTIITRMLLPQLFTTAGLGHAAQVSRQRGAAGPHAALQVAASFKATHDILFRTELRRRNMISMSYFRLRPVGPPATTHAASTAAEKKSMNRRCELSEAA